MQRLGLEMLIKSDKLGIPIISYFVYHPCNLIFCISLAGLSAMFVIIHFILPQVLIWIELLDTNNIVATAANPAIQSLSLFVCL